jgi:hypothetical protein
VAGFGRIAVKIDTGDFFDNLSRNLHWVKIEQKCRVLHMKIQIFFVVASEIKCCFSIATVVTRRLHTYIMHTLSALTSFLRGNLLSGFFRNQDFSPGATDPTGPGTPH